MFTKLRQMLKDEKGTVLVLVAASMVFFAGIMALVTDAGLLYVNHIKLVNALDTAVLAGVHELPADGDAAVSNAASYAAMNGINEQEANYQVLDNNRTIMANATRPVNLIFAKVLGHDTGQVSAVAKAHISPTTAVTGVAPFGVIEDHFEFGQQVVLKEGSGDSIQRGWFGALSLGGTGASNYTVNIEHGYSGKVKCNDVYYTEDGNMSGPTSDGIGYLVSQCTHSPQCTPGCFDKDCPRIIIVPFVNVVDENPAGHIFIVKVVGFGAFLINGYVGNGNDNWVQGSFISYVVPGEGDDNETDYGLYSAQLCD
jgi:hypothetical protein